MPYSRTVKSAVRKALGFSVTNEYLDEAMRQYGAWHLPTLKIEAEDIKARNLQSPLMAEYEKTERDCQLLAENLMLDVMMTGR